MESTENQHKIYVFYQNNSINIQEFHDDSIFSRISVQEYTEKSAESLILKYNEINVSKSSSQIYIYDLQNQIEELWKNAFQNRKSSASLSNKFSQIKAFFRYFEKINFKNINVANINSISKSYNQLTDYITTTCDVSVNHKNIIDLIDNLIFNFDMIINFIMLLKSKEMEFFRIINNITILFNNLYSKNNHLLYKLESCFLDQNLNPFLVFIQNQNHQNIEKEQREQISEVYLAFISQFHAIIIEKISKYRNDQSNESNNKQSQHLFDINDFIETEINSFFSKTCNILVNSFNTNIYKIFDNNFSNLTGSNETNQNISNINFMIPIFSFDHFSRLVTKNLKSENPYSDFFPIWFYFLAEELLDIHLQNIFYGNLTKDDICIYYNEEANAFIPSIKLLYSFDNKIKKNKENLKNSEKSINDYQRDDVNQFIKIILSERPSASLSNQIRDLQTIKDIVSKLRKMNDENVNNQMLEIYKKVSNSFFYHEIEEPKFTHYICISNGIELCLENKDDYFFNLLQIVKHHSFQESSSILNIIKLIFQLYSEYNGNLSDTLQLFISILNESHFFESNHQLQPNQDSIISIFDDIQKQKKYFYFDLLFKIILENILDQNVFVNQTQKNINTKDEDDDDEDDTTDKDKIEEIKSSYTYGDFSTTLSYDKNLFFILEINYNIEDAKKNQKVIENEKKIFGEKISKFVIHKADIKEKDSTIYIPYFPSETLNSYNISSYMSLEQKVVRRSEFTLVDKVVIILEIATALKDLHSHNIYHGYLCSQYIFINSSKDAYLGGFSYNQNVEKNQTKLTGPVYYRAPEFQSQSDSQNKDKDNEDETEEYMIRQQKNDIYSFGVLIHEIITETSLEIRMGNRPREERLNILGGNRNPQPEVTEATDENKKKLKPPFKGTSFEFLFSGSNNDIFKDDWIDERGDTVLGFKEIIEKCMKIDSNERYSSFKELIGCIEALPIYIKNKEEIEFRIKHARDAREYQCTISDLVESYYRGYTNSKDDIEQFLAKYLNKCFPEQERSIQILGDTIKTIFEGFKIKNDEDYSQHFEDLFNLVINQFYNKKLNKNQSVVDEEDYLLKLSREANFDEEEGREIVIPVCSLGSFIENNGNRIEEGYSLTFLYFIAKDLSLIHSNNLYHGEVRADHIGLYYNHETRTLIPSVILYYSYYKNNQNSMNDMNSKKRIPSKMYSSEELVSKEQRKDIKNFKNIAEKLGIPPTILSKIQESETMNEIVYHLYNFIRNNSNDKQLEIFERNYSSCSYSSFVITYPIIEEVFHHIEDNDYSFEGLAIDFENIYQMMNGLLDNIESHPENSIKANLPPFITSTNTTQTVDKITNLIENIKCKTTIIFKDLLDFSTNNIEPDLYIENINGLFKVVSIKQDPVKEFNKIEQTSDNLFRILTGIREIPDKKWFYKPVDRKLDICDLCLRSCEFLIRRYIFNLNPILKYTLHIKIKNKKNSKYQDNDQIKELDIKNIAYKIGIKKESITSNNGAVIIQIDSIQPRIPKSQTDLNQNPIENSNQTPNTN